MALNTKQVGAAAASSVAAATARVGTGGRKGASTARPDVERLDFAQQTNLNEEAILRFQQDGQFESGDRRRDDRDAESSPWSTLGLIGSVGIAAAEERSAANGPALFLDEILRGVGSYEQSIRTTSPPSPKPGSVMNFLF